MSENKKQQHKDQAGAFSFVDLFAGIGGMRLAAEAEGGQCVWGCEWDKFARQTYSMNFARNPDMEEMPEEELAKDIKDITGSPEALVAIPDHDVLLAGFPCQPFSLAGVSKNKSLGREHGFLDKTQGTLFFDLCKVIEAKKPVAFLLENVKNLVSHNERRTWKTIKESLRQLDYALGDARNSYQIIDAKKFVPQHRERTFIVGFRDTDLFRWDSVDLSNDSGEPLLDDILEPEDAPGLEKYVLSQKLWDYLRAYKTKHQAKGNGFGYGLVGRGETARTLSARYYKDGSEILIKRGDDRPRRLTPRECSRLMGFNEVSNFTHHRDFLIPVSDTQAYRQFGNAVVPEVPRRILRAMVPLLAKASTNSHESGSLAA
jgi:DNA (cytosine-5)-methyltransferase 1